jgi:hypothetical protein
MEEIKQQTETVEHSTQVKMICLGVVVASGLLFSLPVIFGGFPADSHDAPSQFVLYKSFLEQLNHGEIYPRWLIGMNDGFGSPTFFFYPPLAYYFTAIWGFILGAPKTDAQVWQQLGFSAATAIIASGITCYFWLKGLVRPIPAAIISVIYLLIPYHLTTDLYIRGALAELWAFVWMPLILKFVRDLQTKPLTGFIGLSLSYSMLIMTHLPTTLLFSLVPIAYALFLAINEKSKAQFISTVLGMGIGIGIADIYLLPAMVARNFISMEPNSQSPLYFANNFLLPFSSAEYSPYITQLTILLVTMIVGIILCFIGGKIQFTQKIEWKFWLVIAGICVLLMIPLSKPVWGLISILQSVQFPYRFNAVLCVAFAALTALTVSNFTFSSEFLNKNRQLSIYLFGTLILCFVWLGFFVKTLNDDKIDNSVKAYRERVLNLRLEFAEQMPKTARMDLLDTLVAEKKKSGSQNFLRSDKAKVEAIEWKPRDILLKTDSSETTNLIVGQFYYPTWEAVFQTDSGEPTKLEVKPSEEGLLQIQIPAGKGQLTMSLGQSSAEKSGAQTSLISLVAMLVGAFILWRYQNYFGLGRKEVSNG